jgi:hypothetical protein
MKEKILKKTLERIGKLQEMKTVQDYRPANEAELALAYSHADKMGVSVSGEVVKDPSGWIIVQYEGLNDETNQFRIDPNEAMKWAETYVSDAADEAELKALETEEIEEDPTGDDLVEAKFKKDDVVIPNMGPMKGQKHRVIHVFPNGEVNIQPMGPPKMNKYRLGAAKAKPNQLELVKEEDSEKKSEDQLAEAPVAGWIAVYNRNKLEIKKGKDAKDLWTAKQFAMKHFKVPKSKQGLLAIKPAYND